MFWNYIKLHKNVIEFDINFLFLIKIQIFFKKIIKINKKLNEINKKIIN